MFTASSALFLSFSLSHLPTFLLLATIFLSTSLLPPLTRFTSISSSVHPSQCQICVNVPNVIYCGKVAKYNLSTFSLSMMNTEKTSHKKPYVCFLTWELMTFWKMNMQICRSDVCVCVCVSEVTQITIPHHIIISITNIAATQVTHLPNVLQAFLPSTHWFDWIRRINCRHFTTTAFQKC